MEGIEDWIATIAVEAAYAPQVEDALRNAALPFRPAGAARGAAETATLIAVSVHSAAAIALLIEKLRRLNLPRTYIYPREGGPDIRIGGEPEIHIDPMVRDGRIIVVHADGKVENLPDGEVTVVAIRELLKPRRPSDG